MTSQVYVKPPAASAGIPSGAGASNVTDASAVSYENHISLKRRHSVLLLATVEGGKAERGAYIKALSEQIEKSDGDTDIRTMHTIAVSDMSGSHQVPEMRDTLDKRLIMPKSTRRPS